MRPILEVSELQAWYGDLQVLWGISLQVGEGEGVAILGANGAGKSSLLRALSGVMRRSGSIKLGGQDLSRLQPEDVTRSGLAHVPEGRHIFNRLTVVDNLLVAMYPWQRSLGKAEKTARIDEVFELFPRLKERRAQLAGTMSGGEQQMLAIARALVQRPRLIVLDEPSQGLAPTIVSQVMNSLLAFRKTGASMVLVEQNSEVALRVTDRAYVIKSGRIVMQDSATALAKNPDLLSHYL